MKRVAPVCAICHGSGVYKPVLKTSRWHLLVLPITSALVGTTLPSKNEERSIIWNEHLSCTLRPRPSATGLLLRGPQAKLSGFTDVNYLRLLLISCLESVMPEQWQPGSLSLAAAQPPWALFPIPPRLPLLSARPEHFILVMVPEARPRRTFEIKHVRSTVEREGGEKRGEKGAISAPQACKSRAFAMPLNVFFSAGHKSCPRPSKGTCLYDGNFHTCLSWCPALCCCFAAFKTL